MPEEKLKICKYCKSKIHQEAKVCSVCGKYQNWFLENIAHSISFLIFLLAIIQLIFASIERSKAEDAFREALLAKKEVKTAAENILEVSKAVIVISEMLPHATGYGGGLSKEDKKLLQTNIEILKKYRENIIE